MKKETIEEMQEKVAEVAKKYMEMVEKHIDSLNSKKSITSEGAMMIVDEIRTLNHVANTFERLESCIARTKQDSENVK